jgi:hypothetical protein
LKNLIVTCKIHIEIDFPRCEEIIHILLESILILKEFPLVDWLKEGLKLEAEVIEEEVEEVVVVPITIETLLKTTSFVLVWNILRIFIY